MGSITTGKSEIFNFPWNVFIISVTRALFVVGEENPVQVFNESLERLIRFTG